jgi:hypothetical protein
VLLLMRGDRRARFVENNEAGAARSVHGGRGGGGGNMGEGGGGAIGKGTAKWGEGEDMHTTGTRTDGAGVNMEQVNHIPMLKTCMWTHVTHTRQTRAHTHTHTHTETCIYIYIYIYI